MPENVAGKKGLYRDTVSRLLHVLNSLWHSRWSNNDRPQTPKDTTGDPQNTGDSKRKKWKPCLNRQHTHIEIYIRDSNSVRNSMPHSMNQFYIVIVSYAVLTFRQVAYVRVNMFIFLLCITCTAKRVLLPVCGRSNMNIFLETKGHECFEALELLYAAWGLSFGTLLPPLRTMPLL